MALRLWSHGGFIRLQCLHLPAPLQPPTDTQTHTHTHTHTYTVNPMQAHIIHPEFRSWLLPTEAWERERGKSYNRAKLTYVVWLVWIYPHEMKKMKIKKHEISENEKKFLIERHTCSGAIPHGVMGCDFNFSTASLARCAFLYEYMSSRQTSPYT